MAINREKDKLKTCTTHPPPTKESAWRQRHRDRDVTEIHSGKKVTAETLPFNCVCQTAGFLREEVAGAFFRTKLPRVYMFASEVNAGGRVV